VLKRRLFDSLLCNLCVGVIIGVLTKDKELLKIDGWSLDGDEGIGSSFEILGWSFLISFKSIFSSNLE